MKNRNENPETDKKKGAKRPYRKPQVHSEDVTERQGLQTCQPVPDAEQGCTPAI